MKNPYSIGTLTAVLGASLLSPVSELKAENGNTIPSVSSESKASRCYWLEAKITAEGLCGEKMAPDIPLITEEAEQGNTLAAFRLGQLYSTGSWGAPRDIEASIKWFEVSASGGFWSAQVKLGFIYEYGRGTERDLKQAIHWYEQAAEQGMYPDLDEKILALQEKIRANDSE